MAFPKIGDAELAEKLAAAFRKHGYEGASLALIAREAGLEKASLYHRFPGGKDEMLAAALANVVERFGKNIVGALAGPGLPAEKLRRAQRGLREFYEDGKIPCALDTLSLPPAHAEVREGLRQSYSAWLEAFAGLARESGAAAVEAQRRAQRAIVSIEGALVVSRVTGDAKAFREAVAALPEILLPKDA